MQRRSAGCGGVLCDEDGQCLGGFARQLGSCVAFLAELWGVYLGLKLAFRKGYRRLEVQCDSWSVV